MHHSPRRTWTVIRTGLTLALAVLLSGCIIVPAHRPHYYRPAYVYPY